MNKQTIKELSETKITIYGIPKEAHDRIFNYVQETKKLINFHEARLEQLPKDKENLERLKDFYELQVESYKTVDSKTDYVLSHLEDSYKQIDKLIKIQEHAIKLENNKIDIGNKAREIVEQLEKLVKVERKERNNLTYSPNAYLVYLIVCVADLDNKVKNELQQVQGEFEAE